MRVNHRIRVPSVRCVNESGDMLGVLQTRDAIKMALEQGLDLVEISPNANPPVCKIMDYGKYMYEEDRKVRQARKKQHGSHVVKEMKFHSNVADNDYNTKLQHIKDFLKKGHKVKIVLTFRGRENAHKELGFDLVNKVLKDCQECCVIDMAPRMMGRSVIAMVGAKSVKA